MYICIEYRLTVFFCLFFFLYFCLLISFYILKIFVRHLHFVCSIYSNCELQTIYTTLVSTHFFTPETSGPTPAAVQLGLSDDKVPGGVKFDESQLRKVVTSMVKVTVELSDRMREMFLPTAQRCHYLFTPRDLGTIFR